MKYSFMSFSTPALSLADMLAVARKYGYDGIEPRMDAGHAHGVEVQATTEQRMALRQQAERSGVRLCCLATSLTYADPAKTDEKIRQSRERIDLAGDLGIPALRVFGGQIPGGVSRDQAIENVADALRAVADRARERGVVICMETHDDWCDPTHVAAVMAKVNHSSVAVNWDIMHPVRAAKTTMDKAFAALKTWIRHLHVHDGTIGERLEMVPIGAGAIDHRRALELLLASGYGGFISGEWIKWEPYETHLPRELATLKRYERELAGY
jgi:sugar phosphate isomerase/epimerase